MSIESFSAPGPGEIIDEKYELLECLGRGAAGSVYRARHVYMGREVAIKLLHSSSISNKKQRRRFLREAKLASRLQHPNVVLVHDYGVCGDVPYLVMEYVRGKTLREVLREKVRLGARELFDI